MKEEGELASGEEIPIPISLLPNYNNFQEFDKDPLAVKEEVEADFNPEGPHPEQNENVVDIRAEPPSIHLPPTVFQIQVTREGGKALASKLKLSETHLIPYKITTRKTLAVPTRSTPPVKTYSRKRQPEVSRMEGNHAKSKRQASPDTGNTIGASSNCAGYNCPTCPAVLDYDIDRFIQHLAIHHRMPYKCIGCSSFLPADENLREEHWIQMHSNSEEPQKKFRNLEVTPGSIWKCDGCPSAFIAEVLRDNHEGGCPFLNKKVEEKMKTMPMGANGRVLRLRGTFQCSICKKVSRNFEEWRVHRSLTHPQISSISCTYCDKSFAGMTAEGVEIRREDRMEEHILRDHHEEWLGLDLFRKFEECAACGLVFKLGSEADKHFLDVHGIPKDKRTSSCPVCHLNVPHGDSHLLKHVNQCHFPSEKGHRCEICGMAITSLNKGKEVNEAEHKLQKHGIIPMKLKLQKCPVKGCQFKSVIEMTMERHLKKLHGLGKDKCKYCGKDFKLCCNSAWKTSTR